MGRLDNKVAVITGGASGMGRAIGNRFVREGAAVVLADLNEKGGVEVVAECAAAGGKAVFQQADVASESEVKNAVARAVKEFGRLDIMVNNAGVGGAMGRLENVSVEDWDRTQAVLLRGVFLGMKHAIPELRRFGGGSIISTASIAGISGDFGPHPYSAAKAGVINLTRSAAAELAIDRIRVNVICPGGIKTPMFIGGGGFGHDDATIEATMAKLQPIRRAGRAEDIAAMALFLASDESEWITGAVMVVDGGALVAHRNAISAAATGSGYAGPSFQRR
ncbi:MAG TPA: SDR family NAD(P)-dependent oxidoreductase [Candidatus Binataceae bacterium]|nr:SDR family NAD(P)-dependent oxidoreductase [Candidatus Binataceae bacterium]